MGIVRPVQPGALIAAVTFADEQSLCTAMERLTAVWGAVAFASGEFAFDMTSYYAQEMGTSLRKRFHCFEPPLPPGSLPAAKLFSNGIEAELARTADGVPARTVNIDPGYVTLSKLVLATTKDYSHRIHIGQGIYGEITLRFREGSFEPFDHTYPDYRTQLALEFFNAVREFVRRNRSLWTPDSE